jgi:hypothetical protein
MRHPPKEPRTTKAVVRATLLTAFSNGNTGQLRRPKR